MRVLVLLAAVTSMVLSEGSCPAFDNSVEPEPTWEDVIDREECYDQSEGCGSCSDLCTNPEYSHWMEKNCPKTCGMCNEGTHEAMLQGPAKCWISGYSYQDEDIYKTYHLQSVNGCRDHCVDDEECEGVHLDGATTKCMMAKLGSIQYKRWGFYAATKDCLERYPEKDCDDHWRGCAINPHMCQANCPFIRLEYEVVCMITCDTCDQGPRPTPAPTVAPTPAPAGPTWTIIEGKKAKGDTIQTGASLIMAKMICEAMGVTHCPGISCKGDDDCDVMRSLDKKKNKTGFTIYKMIEPVD